MKVAKVDEKLARDDDARMEDREREEAAGTAGAEESGAAEENAEFYRTQREIDAAFGRRLRRERERWEKKHARALELERLLGEDGVEEALAALTSQRTGMDGGDEPEAAGNAQDLEEMRRAARMAEIRREADAIRGEDPSFDLDGAMRDGAFRALVEAGEPLRRAYEYANMDGALKSAREQAQMEMLRSMRARGTRPSPMKPQGGPAGADFRNMSEEMLRSIDARLKRGEKVRV